MPPNYTWFKPWEVKGLDPYLCAMLDVARGKAGIPFRITSGLRTPEENKKAGGAPDSLHLRGLAVDIFCADAFARFKIVKAALDTGFKRIEVSKDSHCHLDLGASGIPDGWLGIE